MKFWRCASLNFQIRAPILLAVWFGGNNFACCQVLGHEEGKRGLQSKPSMRDVYLTSGLTGMTVDGCQMSGPKHNLNIVMKSQGDWLSTESVLTVPFRDVHRSENNNLDFIRIRRRDLFISMMIGNVSSKVENVGEVKIGIEGTHRTRGLYLGTHSASISPDSSPVLSMDMLLRGCVAESLAISNDGLLSIRLTSRESIATLRKKAEACLKGTTSNGRQGQTIVTKVFDNAVCEISLRRRSGDDVALPQGNRLPLSLQSEIDLAFRYK